ncbi:hypothetical protein [Rhizobium sp. TRM95796]|uniref:hypothetical protein n=1 Tax=Rhizobium sp. TRM95796 TaxID=2979862 RepID=UPI0021E8C965|nr:hypothetical protein [Rhizobium sp. TRM95796]MCV3766663.1 hypothetical protein [Rhizobium sp. TRM95796]
MPKLAHLTSIAHNLADSLSSGCGFMIGMYDMDIHGEAAASKEGFIDVDFLSGETAGGRVSASLAAAIERYREELPELCRRHKVDVADFGALKVRFGGAGLDRYCVVTVKDRRGRSSVDEYRGSPAARVKVLDALGRVRSR